MTLSTLTTRQKEQLFRELRISITHHSNAIEGVSLSFGETKALLENGTTADGKPLSEQLVVLGFAKAYDVVVREASNPSFAMTSGFIKDLHFVMFEDALRVSGGFIEKPIGVYRTNERFIKGVDIRLSLPHKISGDIENLIFRQNQKMSIKDISQFHIEFEQIHPFADGNGRIGRLLMAFQFIQNDLVPPLILNDNRKEYLDALSEAVELASFLETSQKESLKLIDDVH